MAEIRGFGTFAMQPPARRAAAALGAGVALLAVCAVHIAYGGAASSGSGDAPAAMGAAELRWSAVAPKGEEKARARARLAEKQVSESGKGPAGVKAAEARAKLLFDDWGGIRKEREAKQEEQKVMLQLLWASQFSQAAAMILSPGCALSRPSV